MSFAHFVSPRYRPDIDGLRAIAILAVVMFHVAESILPGGFIGVDVFFVVSGFLISTIIVENLERRSFSFLDFYARRIRRIFPALAIVLLACYCYGSFALLPEEHRQLSKHIAGGAAFVSNFILLNETGYFDALAETKPLLHLWSLAIEEQFYLVWPLVLWLCWRGGKGMLLAATAVIGLASFALNVWTAPSDPVLAFYSPQTRFWQLMAGSALAFSIWGKFFAPIGPEGLRQVLGQVAAITGALLIGLGFVFIRGDLNYPGWRSLLPVIGTVLLIWAGPGAWLNRILSCRLLVWTGLISYPLYLWHWPLLSFARIEFGETPPIELRLVLVGLSVVLAWATFKFVETPIRTGGATSKKAVALLASVATVGLVGYFHFKAPTGNITLRTPLNKGQDVQGYFSYQFSTYPACTPAEIWRESELYRGTHRCSQSKGGTPIQIAIVGDSHAEHLFLGFAQQLPGKNVVYYLQTGLPMLSDKAFGRIFPSVVADPNISTVVLAGYWSRVLNVHPDAEERLAKDIVATVGALAAANKSVYLAEDVPEFLFDPRVCAYGPLLFGTVKCTQPRVTTTRRDLIFDRLMRSLVHAEAKFKLLKATEHFCDDVSCFMAKNGALLYRDRNHLNINGSSYLGRQMLRQAPEIAK
jgi:peptidoglycan/LPS O-acetylase OafA/YrhL